ncbi:hypothetical protein D3C73_742480 [compost metagenome]
MAVAAASFKIVTLSIRVISRSRTFCTLTSKPFNIKAGILIVVVILSLRSTSFPPVGKDEDPRTLIFGKALGLDPARLLSSNLNDGSNTCMAWRTFCGFTCRSSSPLFVIAVPV